MPIRQGGSEKINSKKIIRSIQMEFFPVGKIHQKALPKGLLEGKLMSFKFVRWDEIETFYSSLLYHKSVLKLSLEVKQQINKMMDKI